MSSELVSIHGLLGLDLDAAVDPSNRDGTKCQEKVVAAAGRCSAAFIADYVECARAALKGTSAAPITDEFGLVQCKGSDVSGEVAWQCDAGVAGAIAESCAGQDLDALFPGCAGGDLAACARGYAKAGPNGGLNATAGICGPDPSVPAPPAPEPFSTAEVPVPSGVTVPSEQASVQFTEDGNRLVFSMLTTAVGGRHLATIAEDGSDFQCLTCPLGPGVDLSQPHPATDGERIAVRNGNRLQRHAIVECTPSVVDCQTVELVPVTLPRFAPILRNAQMRIAPDGQHMFWTQIRADGGLVVVVGELVRHDDGYAIANPRALTTFRPIFTGPPEDLVLESVGDWGEAKEFADGGANILYYTTIDSLNFDAVKLDLATGSITRLTRHPEYDEDLQQSRDGQWYVQASFRNYDRMGVFSIVPRPPIVDSFTRNAVVLLRNTSSGRRFFDIFLQDEFGSRDGYTGQQLNVPNDPDWNTRGAHGWHPDGTKLAFFEQLDPDLGMPATRLRVATFTSRSPAPPIPTVTSPDPIWAVPLQDLTGPAEDTAGTLLGAVSGRAEVDFHLMTAPGSANGNVLVEYFDYSDDGRSILNGTEAATAAGLNVEWDADVQLSGCRQGFLAADASFVVQPASGTGTIASEVDGKLVVGLPAR